MKNKVQAVITNFGSWEILWGVIRDMVNEPHNTKRIAARLAHTYKIWSRKGNCPGCNAGTGCNHRGMCWKRAEMLTMDELLMAGSDRNYIPKFERNRPTAKDISGNGKDGPLTVGKISKLYKKSKKYDGKQSFYELSYRGVPVVLSSEIPTGEIWFEQDGKIVSRIKMTDEEAKKSLVAPWGDLKDKKSKGLEKIKSESGYMGKRYICSECHGELTLIHVFCMWCGIKISINKSKSI